jgi:hypothetical protein
LQVPGCGDDDCEETFDLNQHAPDEIGRCSCTGPGKDCACVREFLLHLRPPGINGYDGLVRLVVLCCAVLLRLALLCFACLSFLLAE